MKDEVNIILKQMLFFVTKIDIQTICFGFLTIDIIYVARKLMNNCD